MKTIAAKEKCDGPFTDDVLIRLVLSGQESAGTTLVKRYERMWHSMLLRYLPDYEARQEVIQDTFVRAFHALPGFRADAKFSTWLVKIA